MRKRLLWMSVLAALILSAFLFDKEIRPYFSEAYGLDLRTLAAIFGIGEVFFVGSLVALAIFSLKNVSWATLTNFSINQVHIDPRNSRALGALIVNRLSWILPLLYVLFAGWGLPLLVKLMIGLEIGLTVWVGLGVVGAVSSTNQNGKISVRHARLSDIDAIVDVENAAWGEGMRASRAQWEARIKTFPQGVVVAFVDGVLVGVTVVEVLSYDLTAPILTWAEATDEGFLRQTHNPVGETVYGVDLSVNPKYARNHVPDVLMQTLAGYVIRHNKRQVVIGSRLPGYHRYADKMSAQEYALETTRAGRPLDPELRLYQQAGFRLVTVLPNYFPDPESRNYGAIVVRENPFYSVVKRLGLFGPLAARLLARLFRVKE